MEKRYCTKCGSPLQPGDKYCGVCGQPVTGDGQSQPEVGRSCRSKSKTASILLAVFLGFWTWLYTFKRDGWKFWVGLGVTILGGILASAGVATYVGNFSLPFFIFFPSFFFLDWPIRIWAIVDTAIKSDDWYRNYC